MIAVRKPLAVAAVAAGVLMMPAGAYAATVYNGSDFAYNTGTYKVTACDRETDGHSVYSDYSSSTSGRILTTGGNGTCASASTSNLRSFNICEQIPSFPDSCSNRVYI